MGQRARGRHAGLIVACVLSGLAAGFVLMNEFLATTGAGAVRHVVTRPQAGTEFLAIFVGSSTCGASEFPGLVEAVQRIRMKLRSKTAKENKLFISIGVALDQDPWVGIKFLEQFGPFDEVLSGGSWLNTGSLAYILRDFPSRRAIPQLILVERDVMIESQSIASVTEQLVGRRVGADAIVSFAEFLDTAKVQ